MTRMLCQKWRHAFRSAACALAFAAAAGGAFAAETGVARATLDNGLRVVVVRNALAPVVATAMNYFVGGDEAPPGFPGTAHALEHMMFRGSRGMTADQLANMASIMGGKFNADTRQSITQYLFTVPAEDLDVALHIEAVRMRDALDSAKEWEQERGAIKQEVAQDLSNPTYVLYTKLRAALFRGSVYERDPLGTLASFDKTTAAALKRFYERWYAPNNALLIVVGDLDPAATLSRIRTLFGPIPMKQLGRRPAVRLQPVRAQSLRLQTDLPYSLHVTALRLPGLDSPDYAAVEVLADVLSSRRGALYELVPQGKALDAEFSFEPLPKAGLGYAAVAFPAGGDAKGIAREVRAILARIARDGVPPDLVAAAKLRQKRAAELAKNSIEGLAMVWSEAVALYGLGSPEDEVARIEKVTVADVNRAARKYLDAGHAVTALLTPQESGKPVTSTGFGHQEKITLGEAKPTPLPEWASSVLERLSVPDSRLHPTVSTLANGITLIVQPEDVNDSVSVFGQIRSRPELAVPPGKEGLSRVLDELFRYGSETRDRLAFERAADAIGVEPHAGTTFSVQALRETFDRAVELLADEELRPALPPPAFEIVKRQVAQAVAGELRSPSYLAQRALRAALFPKDDPSLREATPATVGAITLADVRAYHRAAFRPDLATIVVIGNIAPEQAQAVIRKHFGAWSATGPKPPTELPPVPPNRPAVVDVPDASRVQNSVQVAETLGLARSHPDYYALRLGNSILSGSFYSTRLTRDLRKDAGLVYYVGSELEVGKTRAVFAVQYACDPQNVARVHDIVVRELEAMQQAPVTPDELRRAKQYLLRQIPLNEADVTAIAQGMLERARLDLPLDEPTLAARRYLALDAKAVQAAFAKWLRPKDLARVSQGPAGR